MPTSAELQARIEAAIADARAEVESPDDVHFTARVVSGSFAGLTRVAQHKMVYDIFAGELGGTIHALSLKTETP
jgi:stress-induced morphogen